MDHDKIIETIKSGNRKFLHELYVQYRDEFSLWAMNKYNLDKDLVGEIYQKTFIALYYNIRDEKLLTLHSSLKTYLFAIGKNQIRDHLKDNRKFVDHEDLSVANEALDFGILAEYEASEMKETLNRLMNKIGEPCRTVIELFYFKHYALDAIAKEMAYKTEQIAAKRKFICLKQMKTLLEEGLKHGEFELN